MMSNTEGVGRSFLAYLVAGLIGAAVAGTYFPDWSDLWRLPPGIPRSPDFAQHVAGARYFLEEGWNRNPFLIRTLNAPQGISVGLTDSLPLVLLLLKPFAAFLPADFQPINGSLALCWTLQPVAAAFLLRSLGERRLLPAIAVSVVAIATPSFLMRIAHEALSAHFVIMLALGLSFRITDPERRGRAALHAASVLLVLSLLIHPYLTLMAAAVLAAAPLTMLLQQRRAWIVVAAELAAALVLAALLAVCLGYAGHGLGAEGFGVFSMNMLSPVWPHYSHMFGGDFPGLDATGGQYEGDQYLGAGMVLACVAAAVACWRCRVVPLRRHPGLAAACLVLTVLAVSNRVYFGHLLLARWRAPAVMDLFHASGRLFWPVVYLLEAGCIARLSRLPRQFAIPLLVVLPLLQFYDVLDILRIDSALLIQIRAFPFNDTELTRLVSSSRRLVVLPPWPCQATSAGADILMDVVYVATRSRIPINTIYAARLPQAPQCDVAGAMRRPFLPGELRVLLPGYADRVPANGDVRRSCRPLDQLTVCSADEAVFQSDVSVRPEGK